MMQVVALIDEDNGVYGASFPDFPGCVTTANDPDEVLAKAAQVLALHINGMIAEGRDLPHVRPLSRLVDDRTFLESSAGAMVALVPYAPTNRPVNLNITIDETLLARIDQASLVAGKSRSMFLAKAAQQRLALRSGSEGTSSKPTPTRSTIADISRSCSAAAAASRPMISSAPYCRCVTRRTDG